MSVFASILAESGPEELGSDLRLTSYSGRESDVRGTLSKIKETEGDLKSAFSKSGSQAYVASQVDGGQIEFVASLDDEGNVCARYRVIDAERIGGWPNLTTRFSLRPE